MKARIRIGLAVGLVLALPAVANATLPSASSSLIVPAGSIGGVKLGSSLAAATRAWGKGGTCTAGGCTYSTTGERNGTASFLLAATVAGGPARVVSIDIEAGILNAASSRRNFNTPLARLRTSSGIGVGSTVGQLRHAYPHLIKEAGGGFYTLKGPGTTFTGFAIYEGRVQQIRVQSVQLG